MSQTISLEEASARLIELVRALRPGDEIVLTDNGRPVARILPYDASSPERLGPVIQREP